MPRRVVAATVAAVALVGAGTAVAATATENKPIKACAAQSDGALRIADSCTRKEVPVTWNVQGPQGPQGERGPQGEPGPTGPASTGGPTVETSVVQNVPVAYWKPGVAGEPIHEGSEQTVLITHTFTVPGDSPRAVLMNFTALTPLGPTISDTCPDHGDWPDWGLSERLVPTDGAVHADYSDYGVTPRSGEIVFVDPGVHTVQLVWDSQYCAVEEHGLVTYASVITQVF